MYSDNSNPLTVHHDHESTIGAQAASDAEIYGRARHGVPQVIFVILEDAKMDESKGKPKTEAYIVIVF